MSLALGTTVGLYAVTAKIGEGGMGEVYRARDTKLDRDVALKVLPKENTDERRMRPTLPRIALVVATGFLMTSAGEAGQAATTSPERGTVAAAFLGGTESFLMDASATEAEYQISVALPLGYEESNASYDVLVGVDANGQFGTLVEMARSLRQGEQIPPLIIVGIGYPVGGYQVSSEPRRRRELSISEMVAHDAAPEGTGGAPDLLAFVMDDLVPLIDSRYRANPEDRALYGHSIGGLFGLYALLYGEGTFSRFIVGSPSLWFDRRKLFDMEAAYAEGHQSLPGKVFLSVGLLDDDELSQPLGNGRMISNVRDLDNILKLRQYQGLEWDTVYFPDENHQSVLGPTITRGLRYIYGALD